MRAGRTLSTGAAVWLAAVLAGHAAAYAQSDYRDKDFSVRMAPAFIKFTEVSAMGGETVANRFSSAINPASVAWFPLPCKHGVVAAPYYSQVVFDNGMRLHLTGESATWDSRKAGVFQPTLSQIRVNRRRDWETGLLFDYEVDTAQLQWGKRWGDFAFGACFNFAEAKTIREGTLMRVVSPIPFAVPIATRAVGRAESYRWRFGALYQPAEKWLTGLMFEYGFQPYRSRTNTTTYLPAPFGPVTTVSHEEGTQHQFLLRPGVSYEFSEMSTLYLDYQFGAYFNNRDSLLSHRFSAGIEYRAFKFLFLRFGPSMDVRGNVGVSCGASVFLSKWASVEAGYQYNMLPELRQEFGRSHTIQVALAVRF